MIHLVHVYLSGPIIHENLRKDDFYRAVVAHMALRGFSVFAPQFFGPADPVEIYTRDVKNVRKCDFLIGEVSNPSLGVGMEIMLAIEIDTPVLLFRHREADPLSKMVLGADGKALFEYSSTGEVVEILARMKLENLVFHYCQKCNTKIAENVQGQYRCLQCGADH